MPKSHRSGNEDASNMRTSATCCTKSLKKDFEEKAKSKELIRDRKRKCCGDFFASNMRKWLASYQFTVNQNDWLIESRNGIAET